MEEKYEAGKTILILDAEGAFNALSRSSTLKTAAQLVPEAYQAILNFYGPNTRAFHASKEMEINEGTIQGCAMSTGVYDIGVAPLVKEMHTDAIVQIWQVDDVSASGDPIPLHGWFQKLRERAPNYGYNIKKGKR